MKIFTKLLFMSMLLACTVSCVHQSFDLEECTRNVRVEPQWINTQPVSENELVNVLLDRRTPAGRIHLQCSPHGTDVDLLPSAYDLIGWETAENVTVRERIVTVASASRAMAAEPGVFSGGTAEDREIYSDRGNQVLYVPMLQQTRELIIRIKFIGELSYVIEKVEAGITGVTLSRDIDDAFFISNEQYRFPALTSGEAYYLFGQEIGTGSEIWYRGVRRFIGMDGDAVQMLQIRVTGVDGSVHTVFEDITGAMDSFQVSEDVSQPMVINLTVSIGVNMELSIVDWVLDGDSEITVS